MDAYNSLLNRASGVANTPYTPYTGELVAGVNQQQYTGINNINQNAGFAAPYIQQAATYANNAAQPLSAAQIQQYQNPYTQSVVNATQGQFNLMNQQALNNIQGNAAMSGALGGDRAGVAKAAYYGAVLPGQEQQIAGLYNQSYTTGLNTAEQQQQNQANAAYSLGNLGVAGQNAALTGANAQIGAGSLEQGTQQALDAALLQQFQTQQAFPYQQTQWLAGIDTGVGSQMGGTSSTTAPAPNPFATIAGLGLTAAGAYFGGSAGAQAGAAAGQALQSSRRGGGIPGFAMGGMPYAGVGWVPSIQITPGRGAPPPPGTPQQQKQSGLGNQTSGAAAIGTGLWNKFNNQGISTDPVGSGLPLEGSADANSLNYVVPMGGEGFGIGGVRTGGGIPGFADGGSPSFNDMWNSLPNPNLAPDVVPLPVARPNFVDAPDIVLNGGSGGVGLGSPYVTDNAALRADARIGEPTAYSDASYPSRRPNPLSSQDPEALGAYRNAAPAPLASGPGYDRSGLGTNSTPSAAPSSGGISGFLANLPGRGSLSPAASQALMAAGLGMMASRSPFLGVAIGEGGLQGLGAYNQQIQQEFSREMQQEQKALDERKVNIAADRLAQEAQQFQKGLNLKTSQAEREAAQPRVIGQDQLGRNIYGALNPQSGKYEPVQPTGAALPAIPAGPAQATPVSTNPMVTNPAGAPVSEVPPAARPEVLASLDPATASTIKALDEGRLQFPGGMQLRTPYWQNILRLLTEYDPSFDGVNYNSRAGTRRDFTSGKSAQNITSFNTAIGHLDTLDKSVDGLNNSSFPWWNQFANWASVQGGNTQFQQAQKTFMAAKQAVVDELTRAFRGSGGNVHDIVGWEQTINGADSPQALHTAVKSAVDLLRSRIESVGDQYNRGMGTTHDPMRLLSPHAQATVDRLEGGTSSQAPAASRAPDAAVAHLRAHPELRGEFDAKYGQGASASILGGP